MPGWAHPSFTLLTLLSAVLLGLAAGAHAQQGSVATDTAALQALYDATNGANWTDNTNWTSDMALSTWHGVTTNGDGRVTRLELQENGLNGTLPTELENLTHLESLLLDRNYALMGPLPTGLRELPALATVDLTDTELCAPEDTAFQDWTATISSFSGLTRAPTEESVIDVAVFYTPQAREAHDGHDRIKAKIDLMVTETNRAYTDSGVDQRINPVVVEEVAYTETSMPTDIGRLKDPSDGHMDEVHAIRDRVWADIVMLIRARGGGQAVTMLTESTSHARNAFGLCGVNSLVFAHELGHIMGLKHDRYEECGASRCNSALSADAYGYVNQRAFDENVLASSRWRTIMSYNSQCDRDGFTCQWLLRFSNPNQLYPDADGDPLGVALTSDNEDSIAVDGPANAVRVLNETRDTVANFRQGRAVKVFYDAGPYSVTEGGTVTVTVRLDAAPGRTLNIPIPLTASSPDGAWTGDYAMPSSIIFGSNQTEQTFSVTAVNDTVQEDEETVLLGFGESLPAGVTVGSQATATVTLTDNDTVAGAPSIAEIAITSEPGAAYAAGEEVEVTMIFTKPVTVTGTPGLGLTIGTTTRPMVYQDARSASEVLVFAYTVADGESDTDGVSIPENSLEGTIRDSANQDAAMLTHAAVDADHTVDGVTPELDAAVADGTVVTLTYDEVLDETSIPAEDAFTVTAAGATLSVDSVEVSEMVVTLTLDSHVVHGQVVRLDYTPGTMPLQDLAGNAVDPLSNKVVTNETAMPVYDTDHDGLIEITTLAQLDAMRHDLDGDGIPVATGATTYATAFPNAGARLTCGVDSGCAGYELTIDLDFDTDGDGQVDADGTYWNNGAGWVPIGTSTDPFATTFEGNGHTIRHLFVDRNTDYVGLFGHTEGAFFVIRHVGLTNVAVTGNDYVGGLVGWNRGGITGSYVTGQVSGHTYTGGLVGYNYSGITGSYATGRVSGHTYTGGLVGYNSGGAIVGSYATGRVSGSVSVGGLAETTGRIITASYATGPVSGDSDVGGLVGLSLSGTITASYWDTTTSGQATGDGGAGQSTEALQAPTDYSGIYADWNVDLDGDGEADDPWHFGTGSQYPVLKADLDGDGTATWQEFGYQLRAGPTLTARAGVGQVVLEWTAVEASHWDPAPAVTYTLTRDHGATVEAIAENLSGLGYTDTDVTAGETYTYQVAAVVTGGEAARSALTTSDPVLPDMWLNPPESDPVAPVRSAATYSVTFQGTWTTSVTSGGVPSGAHFTTLIGGVHNAEVTFLREGGMASAGVESMAELGGTPTLESEINAAMPNAFAVIEQSIASGGTATATVDITLPTDHPRVTLLSMVAPSPDWFVGVSGLTLLDDQGDWLASRSVNLYPWDAGTEEGAEFSLSNSPTSPQGVITSLRGMGKFSNEPIATLTFTRQSVNTAPELMLAASPAAIVEAGGSATVTVEITNGVTFEEDQEIALAFAGTATKGTDYTVALESLTLTAGESSVATTVTAVQDRVDDDAETILITASHGGGAIGAEQTITIIDDDATPCSGGMAGTYPCSNVDLMSFLALADIGGGQANDIWGWTDSSTGKEYAIMGRTNGTSFVDISDPVSPIYLGNLPPHSSGSTFRDIKVYADHAFMVTEARGSGMQVFDLTQLRMVASPPATFSGTAHYPRFSYAHNLVINEDSGFAYAVGTNTCSGGLHMINIQTPANPTSAGCFSADGYTHDAQCVNYDGPDLDHQGKEICFNSNVDTLTIVNVTNKAGPVMLSRTGYSGSRYTHQGWLTEDQVYFLLGDEDDEAENPKVTNTRTYLWDVSDLDAPALIGSHDSTTTATDHNQYVKGSYTYQSNYRAGLRILDITDIANGNLTEVAFFDVYPRSDSRKEDGTWSNYPFFDSGIVIVSEIEQGLFILRPNLVDVVNPALASAAVNGAALTLTYGEVLDESSTPATDAFTVTVAGSGRTVTYVSVSGRVVTLTLASVVAHDETVTVSYSPGTNPIRDAAGNGATGLSNEPVANETPDTTPPRVMSITSEATHPTKDRFTVTIIFTEEVTGLTAGEIVVINGLGSNFAGAGATYTLDIEPSANIEDDVTVRVPADAAVDDANIGNVEGSETFAVDTRTPTVSTVKISSDPGAGRIYAPEDEIQVTVTFSETVEVTGTPRLQIELGGGSRTATYGGGTGTEALVFGYEVDEGESDNDGVGVEADSLSGGTIRDEARNNAERDHDGLAADADHKVDGVKPRLAASGGAVVDGTTLTLTWDEPLDGSSRPETGDFTVAGGDHPRTVTQVRVSGSAVLLTLDPAAEHEETGIQVSYTVPTGVGANPVRDTVGNEAEALSRVAVTNETPDTTAPAVSGLAIGSNPGADQTYAMGDGIEVTVSFSETVKVEGTPQLRLRVGSRTRTAGYLRGSGTAALVFGYEVVEGDEDTDGVSVDANRLTLNGGTIKDEADNGAELAHEALALQAGHQVDGVRPAFVSAAVEGASLTLTYGEALDGGSRPAAGDFTVEVDGSGRSVAGVSVSGSVVTLFLNPAVEHGDTGIRVSYTPGANPIRDAVGNHAQGLSSRSVTNTTGAPNTAPEITGPSSFDVPENQAVARRLAARDTDAGDEVTGWAIVGGADRSEFSIAPDTGELSFREAPDYEAPGDNQYVVRVEVTSGAAARELTAEQTLAVRVTDEREPPEVPEAPAIAGETADSLTVSWSEPDNTGPAITDYDVQVREDGTGGFTGAPHEGPGRSLTLSDLEAGTLYQVQVRATNEEGTSGWSDPGEGMTVTPLTVVMASGAEPPVSGAFTVRFSFSEPVTGFSRSDIDSSQDRACTDDLNNPVFCDPGIGGLETTDDRVFTATVTPQTDRVAHSYTLRLTVPAGAVRSSVGSKPNQEPEGPLEVRVAPPGAPEPISTLSLGANGANGSVRLSWSRPSDNGGSRIIRYEYRYQAVGAAWSEWENVGAGSSGVTVGGLIDGREYVFEVRAVNALGKGAAETAMAVPERRIAPPRPPPAPRPPGNGDGGGLLFPPEAPAGLTALPGEGAVRLEWGPPASDGGTPILRYEYRLKEGLGEFGEWTPIEDSGAGEVNATGYTVGELGNGTVYAIELRAVNLVGDGRESEAVEVVMLLDRAYWSNFRAEDLQGSEASLEHTPFGGTPRSLRLRFGAGLRFEESELDGEGEVTATRMGGYGYRYTSRTTGELSLDYDGGEACELRLTFRGVGAGSYSYRCGGRLGGQGSFRLSGLNRAPEITGAGVFEVAENRAVVGRLEAVDPDEGDEIRGYGITGGADGGLFAVVEETGELQFRQPRDYEAPGDVESAEPASGAGDNEYIVVVEVSSGEGERQRKGSRAVRVQVSDEEEPPEIISVGPFEVVENQTMVGQLEAMDPDEGDEIREYGIAGGADGGLFAVESETGELLFREAPDYEDPGDVESAEPRSGAADNEYIVVVEVSSGEGERERKGSRAIRVRVTDEEEPPEIIGAGVLEVVENRTRVGRMEAVDPDEGDEIRGYGITGGADGGLFAVEAETGELRFREARDYETPGDVASADPQSGAADNEYIVVVEVSSGEGERQRKGSRAIRVGVSDEEEPPEAPAAPAVTAEGSGSLKVSWTEPENRGPEIVDYEVRYREGGEEGYSDGGHQGTGLTVRLSGLEEGTVYEVQVRAVNEEGMSEWSESGEGRTDTEEPDPDDPSDFTEGDLEGRRVTLRQADADGTTRSLELRFGEGNRFEQIESGGQQASTRSEGASRSGSYTYERTGPGMGTVGLDYDDGSSCEVSLAFTEVGAGTFSYDCGEGAPAEGSFRLTTGSLFVPVILSAAGRSNSFFTSELTLTNRGDGEVKLDYTYTAHRGGGSGKTSDVLAPGRQKIETDALGYLRGLGIAIPETGNRIGTLRVEARLGSEVEAVVRTTTAVVDGRAGLAYLGVGGEEGFQVPVYLCGLRQNGQDRSNVAFQNMGAPEEGAITLRTTVYTGEAADATARILEDVRLEPGGFHQYSGLLGVLGVPAQGYVRVERVEGTSPFYAYGVINDQANSDGSFVFPVTASSLEGSTGQTLPVIVETSEFRSELTVTNFSEEPRRLDFQFVAEGIEADDKTATFRMTLEAGRQEIIPDVVEELRRQGVAGLGANRGFYAGPLFVTAQGGHLSGIVIGARTSASDGRGGKYGVFYDAVPEGEAFSREAWVDGLQQNQENRSNLALVNTGEVDDSESVFHLEIYNGETGLLAETVVTKPIAARRWHQINGILGSYAPETRQGYIRIEKVSGANPFLAYGVVNDGGAPGERSGDGAYLPARE